mgnify:CR=1 FL=1
MTNLLKQLLDTRPWLLADGATGTNLFAAGLQSGDAPEMWNIDPAQSEKIHDLNRSFVDAGSDIILTNTFGGNRYRLKLHNAQDRVEELNVAAATLARKAADSVDRPVIVAGSMGPTGEIFEPIGPLSIDAGTKAFAEQAQALAAGGADVLWIETISSIEELTAAIAGAGTTGLPIVCTLSFDTNGRTMMGITPGQIAALMQSMEPHPVGYGANCGTGAAELVMAILHMRTAKGENDVLVAKSNCGIPQFKDGEIVYSGTPELMADYAGLVFDAGARIIGGCCGTTPEHVRAMRQALEAHLPGPVPSVDLVTERLGKISAGAGQLDSGAPLGERQRERRRGRDRRRGSGPDGDGGANGDDTPRF